jgi:SAM-dependent methyltransferase
MNNTGDAQFWDSYAAGIASVPAFLVAFAERALAEARLAPGSTVLDIATGAGTMAVVAARAGFEVVATDFSPAMVELVDAHHIANIQCRVMDGQAMDLPDESFDAAFSMFGITLFDDWRAGLTEMARVLRPGGTGTIGTWALPGGAAGSRLLYELCTELFPDLPEPVTLPGLLEMCDLDRLTAAMTAAGFIDVRIVEDTQPAVIEAAEFDDPDRLFMFNSQWQLLGPTERATILSAITSRRTTTDAYLVPSTAFIATAHRP